MDLYNAEHFKRAACNVLDTNKLRFMAKNEKLYRLTAIYDDLTVNQGGYINGYRSAYRRAVSFMRRYRKVNAMLIYSEKSAIVIKRKWVDLWYDHPASRKN